MLKRIGFIIVVMLSLLAQAQTGKGDWRVHPYYVGDNIKNVIDTDAKVYFLVGNDLFCFDKSTSAIESLNKRVALNDVLVTNIYYNHIKKYLVVTYLNSNIDVIAPDGQVMNLPDIKDAVLTGLKGINEVTFAPGKMLVSTEFGMVIYDDEAMSVIESRLFDLKFDSAVEVGQWTVITRGGRVYAALNSALRETAGSYQQVSGMGASSSIKLIPVDDDKFMVNSSTGLVTYTLGLNSSNKPTALAQDTVYNQRAAIVEPTPSGFVASFPDNNL